MFTETSDYENLPPDKKHAIGYEVFFIGVAIDTLFSIIEFKDIPVVVWKEEEEKRLHKTLYRFSSFRSASQALETSEHKFVYCKGDTRYNPTCKTLTTPSGVFILQDLFSYEKSQALRFNPEDIKFEFK